MQLTDDHSLELSLDKNHMAKTNTPKRPRDLQSHPEPFLTIQDLARYWGVSRRLIYKQVESGVLPAIRIGPRSLRIPTRDAIEFEQRLIANGPAIDTPSMPRVARDTKESTTERSLPLVGVFHAAPHGRPRGA
jgi:excisionase family DNA binding protein